jgi:hypothetical protein
VNAKLHHNKTSSGIPGAAKKRGKSLGNNGFFGKQKRVGNNKGTPPHFLGRRRLFLSCLFTDWLHTRGFIFRLEEIRRFERQPDQEAVRLFSPLDLFCAFVSLVSLALTATPPRSKHGALPDLNVSLASFACP